MKELDPSKTYLITGGAGFIGFHLSKSLLEKGARVIGFDNMNDYYDVSLKEDRLAKLYYYDKYTFVKGDLADNADVFRVFQEYRPNIVVNLGGAGGRPLQHRQSVRLYGVQYDGIFPYSGGVPLFSGGASGVRFVQFRLRREWESALFHRG